METLDYRDLLRRYMELIIDCESISYLAFDRRTRPRFSLDELAELARIENEVRAEDHPK